MDKLKYDAVYADHDPRVIADEPACSAPDEVMISDIAYNARFLTPKRRFDSHEYSDIALWAIREYIRRSAGKEKG